MIKKFVLCFLLFAVCACGFSPMYSDNRNVDVYVERISGTNGIDLRNALNAEFGGPHDESAKYFLDVKLAEPITKYKALQTTGDATWQEVGLRATYTLKQGDKVIVQGSESAAESYTFVGYLVAANASYNNAVQNGINVLANKIGMRVLAVTGN